MSAAKKKNKKKQSAAESNERVVAQNRKARHDFDVLETLECGIVLQGSEVKSLRCNRVSLDEAYARVMDGEVWLLGCDIPEYREANVLNHKPKRPRKLLLHRREIKRFAAQAYQKGLTLVPLKMYFTRGKAKVLLAVCRGRKQHDKRERLKREESQREIRRTMQRWR
ncbi:MAG: SsrA-binding protein SmpB [Planctomycetota bacterium]|nr:MAG: SsrA-binding protein SmpB [Planctomycetota bacterium]